ncbi:HET domain-containing protein [Microdochium nivale]|nr:HET domain-containing protein [Microdochium nivale]
MESTATRHSETTPLLRASPVSTQQSYPIPPSRYPHPGPEIPLGERVIRLLHLESPSPEAQSTAEAQQVPLRGRLCLVALRTRPHFTALSYVWGEHDVSNPRFITCGSDIMITENCYQALWHIRERRDSTPIWIDAICINQANAEEKADQVAMMDVIYQSAQLVYVWMVPSPDKNHEKATRYLAAICKIARRIPFGPAESQSWEEFSLTSKAFVSLCQQDARKRLYLLPWILGFGPGSKILRRIFGAEGEWFVSPESVGEILNTEWLQRAWTLQEIVLANSAILLCGNAEVQWEDLVAAVKTSGFSTLPFSERWETLVRTWLRTPLPITGQMTSGIFNDRPKSCKATKLTSCKYAMYQHHHKRSIEPLMKIGFCVPVAFILSPFLVIVIILLAALHQDQPYHERPPDNVRLWLVICTMVLLSITFLLGLYLADRWWRFCHGEDGWSIFSQPHEYVFPEAFPQHDFLYDIRTYLISRKCSKPHDKCYSLRGVLRARGIKLPRPDYAILPKYVHRDFFVTLLEYDPLAILLLMDSSINNRKPDAPSWIPDWSKAQVRRWPPVVMKPQLSCSTGLLKSFQLVDGRVLRVPAFRIGCVALRSPLTLRPTDTIEEQTKAALVDFSEWISHVDPACLEYEWDYRSVYGTNFSEVDLWNSPNNPDLYDGKLFCRTVIEGSLDSTKRLADSKHPALALAALVLNQHRQHKLMREQHPEQYANMLFAELERYHSLVWNLARRVWRDHSCLFTLLDGFPGTGTEDLRPGDELFYVPNVPALMVFRKRLLLGCGGGGRGSPPGYEVVGPAMGPFEETRLGNGPDQELEYIDLY